MADLGYIGLGVMGGRMAARLLDRGHRVTGYNRTRSKAQWLVDRGMRWADSPRGVAESSDIVIVMVTDSAAVESVVLGAAGVVTGLKPGALVIDMSTISPSVSRTVATQVRARGGDMIDAPVSGSPLTLEQGKLSMMVGGTQEAFERARPILEDIGPKVTHVGGNGLAVSMKLAINLSLAVQMLAFSEGVLLAEKSGIPRATAVDVMTNSVIASPMVQYRGPFVLGLPAEAWFTVNLMQKDLNLALDLGRELDVTLPATGVTSYVLSEAQGAGFADQDFAAVFHLLARMAGVTP